MNNEEKAKKIAMPCPACSCLWTKDMMYKQEYCKDCVPQDRFTGAMEMAQWKDEQLDSAIDKALERNGDFLKQGKITQYGYDIAFATIQNIREYLKQ